MLNQIDELVSSFFYLARYCFIITFIFYVKISNFYIKYNDYIIKVLIWTIISTIFRITTSHFLNNSSIKPANSNEVPILPSTTMQPTNCKLSGFAVQEFEKITQNEIRTIIRPIIHWGLVKIVSILSSPRYQIDHLGELQAFQRGFNSIQQEHEYNDFLRRIANL